MAYGPKVTIDADTKERSERGLTTREQTDRDTARAASDILAARRAVDKQTRADDLAALPTATDAELRAILSRRLR